MSNSQSTKRVAAVTGATGAIGKSIARQLASEGFGVILLTRNAPKSSLVVEELIQLTKNENIHYELVDLSSRASIQSLASSWEEPLHVLINNAAISPTNREETKEGIELQFATNVLGYFWMTELFSNIIKQYSPSRIINVASYWAGGLDLNDLEFKNRPYHNHASYRQSKQANRMLTPIFAELLKSVGITVNTCHPGDVNSALSNSLGFGGSQSPAQGAKTPAWLATSPTVSNITGKYFENCKEVFCPFGLQTSEAQQLFKICQSYT
jgi:NAD(P)-dependent dehydrogenase (short-subunit alcohol dehydrogenase family)